MDKKDPICGMKGTIPAHGHFFCSEHCIRKYEEQQGIKPEKRYSFSCGTTLKKPWYKEKLYLSFLVVIILLVCSYVLPFLRPFFDAFMDYFSLIWWAILIGFIIGGLIDYFIPRSYIEKYLSRHQKRTILYSILLGFLMSACSHGILAISIELYKKGANTSSVIAFLLSSPWANLPITILLFGFFGLNAVLIVVSAIIIAMVTGIIYLHLETHGWVECNKCIKGYDTHKLATFSILDDIRKRWHEFTFTSHNITRALKGTVQGSWALSKMVLWWLLLGMIMAAFARGFIPTHLFMDYMGPTILGLTITLLFATIIEVCSEGSSPLAFEIFNQTGAFGNSFTFLMAGVATDYTEIGLIWHNIGKKAAVMLPLITVPQILTLGFLFNLLI
jgi:uncharacterized membrane protein YraQ (UPF0718 family)